MLYTQLELTREELEDLDDFFLEYRNSSYKHRQDVLKRIKDYIEQQFDERILFSHD